MPLTTSNITFGRKYRDTVTGFVGVATAYCVRQSGHNQAQLEGVDAAQRPITEWVGVERLAFVDEMTGSL